jgi:dTDP-4-dehydrorhamnose 3,5-epimerase-like enzyme
MKVARFRGQNPHVFFHMRNIDPIQIQQYYEKQVMLRGSHIQEGEDKRRKLIICIKNDIFNNFKKRRKLRR